MQTGYRHEAIKKIILEHGIDGVISDNRYGCWSDLVPSTFITHQLQIRSRVGQHLINYFNRKAIRKFSNCWVPVIPGRGSLAGELTYSEGVNVEYIGYLSRLKKKALPSKKYEIVAIISGPEPQRTIFETIVRRELRKLEAPSLMIKGFPSSGQNNIIGYPDEVNHLSTSEMNDVLAAADMIISRHGYSTVMDLATMGKKAIFVPTPGQTEQEYLGRRLMEMEIAYCAPQNTFNLPQALDEARNYPGFTAADDNSLLETVIDRWLRPE